MLKQIRTRLAALLCAAALMVSFCPVVRAEADAAPYIAASTADVYPGGQCTVWIDGCHFEGIAALELVISYDSSVLTVQSTNAGSMDYSSVNTANVGYIQYSGISFEGVSGDPQLLSIDFTAAEDAPAGNYKVSVFVREAVALVDDVETNVTMTTRSGMVRIEEAGENVRSTSFYLSYSSSEIVAGDTMTMTLGSWEPHDLAAGQFTFEYDSSKFEYVGLELLANMKNGLYVHTVNDINAGVVVLSYASDTAVSAGALMRLTLKAKDNARGSAQIRFTPGALLDENESELSSRPATGTISIISKVDDDASVWVEMPESLVPDEVFTANFWVAGSSALAAGDFSLVYDRNLVECLSVASALASDGESLNDTGIVIINDEYSEGAISFSFLNSDGIAEDTCLITAQFRVTGQAFSEVMLSPVCTSTPVDKNIASIELKCADAQAVILGTRTGTCDDNLTWTLTEDGVLTISGDGDMNIYDWGGAPWYECRKYISSVVICDGVMTVGHTAFMDCIALESVTFPQNIRYVNSYAFWNCQSLREITLPDGITNIGYGTFYGCTALESITIPASVTYIYGEAFYDCEALADVTFTGGPLQWENMWIGDNNECLTAIKVKCTGTDKLNGECGENVVWALDESGVLTISGTGDMQYSNCHDSPWYSYRKLITSAVIEDGVTSIGGEAFCGCEALESVTIGESVTRIDAFSFEYCTSLENIEIPDSVDTLSSGVFYGCTSLEEVVIPDGVTSIEWGMFFNCHSLTSVTIPASVTYIADDAFGYCTALTSVTFTGGPLQWESMKIGVNNDILYSDQVTITCTGADKLNGECGENVVWALDESGVLTISGTGAMDSYNWYEAPWYSYHKYINTVVVSDGVTIIGNCAFCECTNLTSVTVGKDVTRIENWVFQNCTALTDIELPKGLTTIYSGVFQNCVSLESIVIPAAVEFIGYSAFDDCCNLTRVYYCGSEEDWRCIAIGSNNTYLQNAEIIFNWGAEEKPLNGLNEDADGIWRYYVDGVVTDYTGLVTHTDGKTYYVYRGVVPMGYIGLYSHTDGKIYYIYYGVAQKTYVGLYAHSNGVVYYIDNGTVSTTYTGLYAHSDGKSYYVYKGVIPTSYIGLCYHTDGKTYYIFKGVAVSSYTGLYDHTDGKVYYVNKGVIDPNFVGLCYHTDGTTYYVYKGIVLTNYVGLYLHTNGYVYYVYKGVLVPNYVGFYYHTDGKLYYMSEGVIAVNYTGLAQHTDGKLYYVENGVFDPTFNGTATDKNGNEYEVVNGIAQP